jgi:hypothetical protein
MVGLLDSPYCLCSSSFESCMPSKTFTTDGTEFTDGKPLAFIRVIREIRGRISLIAALARAISTREAAHILIELAQERFIVDNLTYNNGNASHFRVGRFFWSHLALGKRSPLRWRDIKLLK